jgi:hypothetical protein
MKLNMNHEAEHEPKPGRFWQYLSEKKYTKETSLSPFGMQNLTRILQKFHRN